MSVEVELWTDGSGRTRGPIGFAWVLVHLATGVVATGHAGALNGTNNRAELLAVIHGLGSLKRRTRVEVVTDSEYVGKAFPQDWITPWKAKHWMDIKNPDLWQELDRLVNQHEVSWRLVRGHIGLSLNEQCDYQAGECRRVIEKALGSEEPIERLGFEVIDHHSQGEQLGMVP